MPDMCAAIGCSNQRSLETKTCGITFHIFPKEKQLRRKWELSLRRKCFVAHKRSVCCSKHFQPEDFDRTGQTVRLRDGSIPSVFCFSTPRKVVAPRTTQTSRKAEESRLSVEGPQHSQQTRPNAFTAISKTAVSITATTQDHPYALPGSLNGLKALIGESKRRESRFRESLVKMTLELRKVQARERRSKKKVLSLLEDLRLHNELNEELKSKLDYFSDVPMALLAKQGHEFTKDQREFAHTLHQYGPKAYEYLRSTLHLNLPHPHTLQRWNLQARKSNISDLDCLNGTGSEVSEGTSLECPARDTSVTM